MTATTHPAPDLARLPITHNLRALSLAEGLRAALSVAVIIALSETLGLPVLRESALGALLTCLCDPGGRLLRGADDDRGPGCSAVTVPPALVGSTL